MKDKTDKVVVSTDESRDRETLDMGDNKMFDSIDGVDGDVRKEGAVLEGSVQNHIGRKLRAHYGSLVNEKVPDQFINLLEELAKKDFELKKDDH
jgi:hypothetical protein